MTRKATEVEAKPKPSPIPALIEQAKALLHAPNGGYNEAHEHFDRGVQAVIDLLHSAR